MSDERHKLILTEDGSHTVFVPELNITFHSRHGAIGESKHIFIEAGLHYITAAFPDQSICILEVGFGTGLNAFLTAIELKDFKPAVRYTAIETHPLEMVTTTSLNYPDRLGHEVLFNTIQISPWNASGPITENFTLQKELIDVREFSCKERYHLVYFDAFSPEAQPELWTEEVFARLAACMQPGGALVTYCSKTTVRRALEAAGWTVEKLGGPWGKREMVRAIRNKS